MSPHPSIERARRFRAIRVMAQVTEGVISRRDLHAAGLSHWQIEAELRGRRWAKNGPQAVIVHNGPIAPRALRAIAVVTVGADAALDGVSALIEAGLTGYDESVVHVSVSKGARYRRRRGVRVHETRRRRPDDVVDSTGIARVEPATAAVRGALWASSNRQAALIWAMCVQQKLVTPDELQVAFSRIKRDRRRRFLRKVLLDIAAGSESMGELDFVRACRRRGLPQPSRQVRRVLPNGRAFLDLYWDEFGVVVEIEGAHHLVPAIAVSDSLRQNELTIDGDRVLRVPLLGIRIAIDEYLDQLERALVAAGWRRAA